MWSSSDPMAVVDAHGHVHGVDGLSVVDASVMPSIPSANTNLPTMVVAERIVELRRRAGGTATAPPPPLAEPV